MLKACSISKFGNWCCHSPSRRLERTLYDVLLFLPWCLRPERWESTSYYTSAVWLRTMKKKTCSLRDPLWTSDGLSYQRYLFPYAMFARHQSWHAFNTIIVAYSDTLWPEECTTISKAVVLKYVTIEENTKLLSELLYLSKLQTIFWSFLRPLSCIWPNICHNQDALSSSSSKFSPLFTHENIWLFKRNPIWDCGSQEKRYQADGPTVNLENIRGCKQHFRRIFG